jgi:drug/metabolite transporter (DMT)-like permease
MLGLAITVVIWASNNIVAKIIMRETSPLMVALLRFTLAGLLFYLPVFLALHRGEQRFTRAEWPRLILLGTTGTTGSLVLYLFGLRTTPANEAAIYQITTPLFVILIARLWLGEHITRARALGLGLAALGALLLVTGGGAVGLGGGDLIGALFLLASSLTWAGYTLISKEILARRSPLLVLAAANLTAMAAIWPIAGLLGVWAELPSLLHWSPEAWLILAYLVAFMSTTSQWLYVRCLRDLNAGQASAFLYLQPLFTVVLAAIFLNEMPTLLTLGSGLLILGGVWLVNRPQRLRRPAKPSLPMHDQPALGSSGHT